MLIACFIQSSLFSFFKKIGTSTSESSTKKSETATKKQVSPNENTPLKQSVIDLDDDGSPPIKRTQSKKREISFESDEEIEAMGTSPVKEQVATTTPSKVEETPKTPS